MKGDCQQRVLEEEITLQTTARYGINHLNALVPCALVCIRYRYFDSRVGSGLVGLGRVVMRISSGDGQAAHGRVDGLRLVVLGFPALHILILHLHRYVCRKRLVLSGQELLQRVRGGAVFGD